MRSGYSRVRPFIWSTVSIAALVASAAQAQQAAPAQGQVPPDEAATNSTLPETTVPATEAGSASSSKSNPNIVITGSRIRRPNLESVVPVTSIQGENFFRQGNTSVGDQLNDLPMLRSTFAQQNPGLGIGIAGLNLLDLRGLQPKRTLVLVNGRRHVPADILSSASVPDVNTVPNDLIERVDIVTGGNSAVYGSDAVAGVVNFILKQEFDGFQVRGQVAEAAAGFGLNYVLSGIAGTKFGGGRGSVILAAEYTHQDRVFGSDVPWLRKSVDVFGLSDVDTPGLPNGSDGFPDRVLLHDVRLSASSPFGLLQISQRSANPTCGVGLAPTNGAPSTVGGVPYNCTFLFLSDGSFTAQTGTRTSTGPVSLIVGGNGPTGREGDLLSIFPKMDRFNLNLVGRYGVSDAFEPFVEAKWSHQEVAGNNASPSAISGAFTQFDIRERIRLDNPFLTAAQRTQIAGLLTASGCAPSATVLCNAATPATRGLGAYAPVQTVGGALNATDLALINSGVYRFQLGRTLADIGIRDELFTRDTYRGVIGARGTFNDDWTYELSANYGRFDETDNNRGFLDKQRFLLSLDSGRNPATGQIQCRAQFDPAARVPFSQNIANPANAAALAARLDADIAACVPYNPFGAPDNKAAAAYFLANDITKHIRMTQLDLMGFVSGDSSQLFELPGGPVSLVLGGEYRRETARYIDDPRVKAEQTNNVIISDFTPPVFHVAEAYGEVRVPILKDMPLFHELSASGAGRFSQYDKRIGKVWTFNVGGEYAPVRDIRFRGNYGKAVRAPNVSEAFFPQVPNFANSFVDPCTPSQIASNPNRQANCQADLGGLLPLPQITQSLPVISGSNPNLKPEVSRSLTLGAVVQPRFIPGLSLSADYYNIDVKKVIIALSAQQIANLCYDQASLSNQFCGLFTRWRGPGLGPLGEAPGQILGNSLIQAGVNIAKRTRRGVDINVNYRSRLSSKVTLDAGLIWVHGLKSSNFNDPVNPAFEDRILSEIGDPKDEGRLDLDLKVGQVTFGYNARYIAPMYLQIFEDFGSLPTACTPAGCPPNNSDFASVSKFPAISYHGIRVQWDTGPFMRAKNIQLYAGMDNIFDRHAPYNLPPGGSITSDRVTGGQTAIYDARGRNVFAGIKARF